MTIPIIMLESQHADHKVSKMLLTSEACSLHGSNIALYCIVPLCGAFFFYHYYFIYSNFFFFLGGGSFVRFH